ncbi:hypothetical protein [Streptomyces griseoviridis]|uniref:hypothetical protein n=1 Tax=Streptomyces griseoviridis TaxID=45398 RepID=UPI0027E4BD88|nr:hypothetical protein [Streptomyces griseoviridis]
MAQFDGGTGRFGAQWPSQRRDGRLGPRQLVLEPLEVLAHQVGAHGRVRGGRDPPDVGERYVEFPQPGGDLCAGDLAGGS